VNKDTRRKPLSTLGTEPQIFEEEIRRRAYELYEARGREDGHNYDDWLSAEEEITKKKASTTAA
jgi:hypothetical protein